MAPLAVTVFGAVMLMILQPFIDVLLKNAGENKFDMGPVITIGIIVTVFVMVVVGVPQLVVVGKRLVRVLLEDEDADDVAALGQMDLEGLDGRALAEAVVGRVEAALPSDEEVDLGTHV